MVSLFSLIINDESGWIIENELKNKISQTKFLYVESS